MKFDQELWDYCRHLTTGIKPDKLPFFFGNIGQFNCYIVDGDYVKVFLDMPDYVEANNSVESPEMIGKIVPWDKSRNQIWIDFNLDSHEWPFELLHESHEVRDMRRGMKYDQAHNRANKQEMHARRQEYQPRLPIAKSA